MDAWFSKSCRITPLTNLEFHFEAARANSLDFSDLPRSQKADWAREPFLLTDLFVRDLYKLYGLV
jgi:hypothetical protein